MSKYSDKFKDPRWQKRRTEIMNRDEFSCQICGDEKNTLNVHHILYKKGAEPWEYEDHELLTVCEKCHTVFIPEFMSKLSLFINELLSRHKGLSVAVVGYLSKRDIMDKLFTYTSIMDDEKGKVFFSALEDYFSSLLWQGAMTERAMKDE